MKEPLKVIILSSSEAKAYALQLCDDLRQKGDFKVETWLSGELFKPTHSNMEGIEALSSYDYAIVFLSPDDKTNKRGEEKLAPRDNLIFELGYCLGALGKRNVFFLQESRVDYHLPTDLSGIVSLRYIVNEGDTVDTIIGNCAMKISTAIKENEKKPNPKHKQIVGADNVTFWHSISDRRSAQRDVPNLINNATKRVIIIGLSLNYIAQYCWGEIEKALERDVKIVIVLIPNKLDYKKIYSRFRTSGKKTSSLDNSLHIYKTKRDSLSPKAIGNFEIYFTSFPFMQSIGLYDELISVSPFCTGGDIGVSPSFEMNRSANSYNIFLNEIKEVVNKATPIFESCKETHLNINII